MFVPFWWFMRMSARLMLRRSLSPMAWPTTRSSGSTKSRNSGRMTSSVDLSLRSSFVRPVILRTVRLMNVRGRIRRRKTSILSLPSGRRMAPISMMSSGKAPAISRSNETTPRGWSSASPSRLTDCAWIARSSCFLRRLWRRLFSCSLLRMILSCSARSGEDTQSLRDIDIGA